MKMIDLYIYEGEEHSRVLAKSDTSPTGFMSMTGAFPTAEEAINILIEVESPREPRFAGDIGANGWGGNTVRFWNLEGDTVLKEVTL